MKTTCDGTTLEITASNKGQAAVLETLVAKVLHALEKRIQLRIFGTGLRKPSGYFLRFDYLLSSKSLSGN